MLARRPLDVSVITAQEGEPDFALYWQMKVVRQ
jgi:hypothetical protein